MPYQRAGDGALPQLFAAAGRITGGACRASGEHKGGQPSQQVRRAFDGSSGSKWLDFGAAGAGGSAWLEYRLLPGQDAAVLSHYDLMAAEDCPERDPCDWLLECVPEQPGVESSSSSSSNAGWVVLDEQRGQVFSRRQQLHSFVVPEAARVASRRWRLRITRLADPAAANSVQLACWNLYSSSAAQRVLYGAQKQQQQVLQKGPQLNGSSSTAQCMLYVNTHDWPAITRLIAGSSSAGVDAGAGTPQLHGKDIDAAAVDTVQRIVHNMQRYPSSAKFWQLGTSGSKIQPVLHHSALLGLLLQLGFRPVLGMSPAAAEDGQCVRLIADESSCENVAVLQLLQG
jgi:hypothetical protein